LRETIDSCAGGAVANERAESGNQKQREVVAHEITHGAENRKYQRLFLGRALEDRRESGDEVECNNARRSAPLWISTESWAIDLPLLLATMSPSSEHVSRPSDELHPAADEIVVLVHRRVPYRNAVGALPVGTTAAH
jgi:hypothetical protein